MPIISTLVSEQESVFQYLDYVGDDHNPLVVVSPVQSEVIRYLFSKCVNLIHMRSYTASIEDYRPGCPEATTLSNDPLDPSYALFYQYGWEWIDLVRKGRPLSEISPATIDLNDMKPEDRNHFLNPHHFWVRFICGMCGIEADLPRIPVDEQQAKHVKEFDLELLMVHCADFRDKLVEQSVLALTKFGKRPEGIAPADFIPLYQKIELGHIYDEIDPSDSLEAHAEFVEHLKTVDFTKPLSLEWDGDFSALDKFTAIFNDDVRLKAKKNYRGEVSSYYEQRMLGVDEDKARKWECNVFPASSLIALFTYLEKVHGVTVKKMFDPMSGWGDRLLAAALSGVEYFGNDANKEMGSVYASIMLALSTLNACRLPMTSYSVSDERIEDLDVSDLEGKYDLAFTSPPYFSLEMYGAGDTAIDVTDLSKTETVAEYVKWMKSFGVVFIEKCISVLRTGGILGLHLSDFSLNNVRIEFKKDFTKLCLMKGLTELPSWGYAYEGGQVREFLLFKKE